jgi:hypothetical protein
MDTVNNFLSEYAIHDYVQYFFNACMILLIFGAIINKLFPDVDKSTDEETDMKHPDDMSLNELEQFDDGDYYIDERGDGGLRQIGYTIVASAFAMGGLINESWWIAAPAIPLILYCGISTAARKQHNKVQRLRAVAQEHYEHELVRQAEEKMV